MAEDPKSKTAIRKKKSSVPAVTIDSSAVTVADTAATSETATPEPVPADATPVTEVSATEPSAASAPEAQLASPEAVAPEQSPAEPVVDTVAGETPAIAAKAPDATPAEPEMAETPVSKTHEPKALETKALETKSSDKTPEMPARSTEKPFDPPRSSEPPPWQSANPPPPPSRLVPMLGAGVVGGIVGAVAMALIGGGMGQRTDGGAIEARLAGLEQVLTSSKDVVDKTVNRVASVETAIKTTATTAEAAANVAAEARSVADQALARPIPESTGGAPPVDLGPIETRIGAIESLAAAAATQSALAAAEQRISTLEARPVASGTDRSAAIAVSLTTLAAAIESGRPFVPELRAASAIVQDDDKLAALAGFADRGAPSAATLARDFDAVAPKLLEAINTEATGASQSSDLFAQLLDSASQVVIIKKVGDETTDAAAPVKKTREALLRGDVAAAIAAFDTMPDAIRTLGETWRSDAGAALTAADAVAKLRSDALAALGG
jgi:hypothetical protein